MRKIFQILLILPIVGFCATEGSESSPSKDSISIEASNNLDLTQSIQELKSTIEKQIQEDRCLDRYKLYPTTNMYNFIKLDTRTGIMSIVQWSLDDGKEFEYSLNERSLVYEWNDSGCGTFELYPTTNHYQFLLLNKANGKQWHVQWGFEKTERWVRRIY